MKEKEIIKIKFELPWTRAFEIYFQTLESAPTKEGRALVWKNLKSEILRLAKAVDEHQAPTN